MWKPARLKIRAGFTLIELMVVIIILALLFSILIPAVSSIMTSSLRKASAVEIQQIENALRLYESDYRDFPPSTLKELGLKQENGINSGIESLVLCLSSRHKTASYYEFQEDKLENTDADISPIPLKVLVDSIFNTNALLELVDPWGNPYIYFHSRDLTATTKQLYNIGGTETLVTPYSGESKTGLFPGYGRYQILSSGPDNEIHSEDDVRSK